MARSASAFFLASYIFFHSARGRTVVSTSVACARSAPTRASSLVLSVNGSQLKNFAEFCQVNYGVTFPMMAKVDVKGDDADPLFTWLTAGDDIQWNFTKFVIGRDGEVAERFDTRVEPATMSDAIEKALSA